MNAKNVTTLSFLIVALAIGYYFAIFLPKHQEKQLKFEQQKQDFSEQNNPNMLLENCLEAEKQRFVTETTETCKLYPGCWENGSIKSLVPIPQIVKEAELKGYEEAKDECYKKYKSP